MEPKKSMGLSVASMVLGIIAIVMSCCFYYVSLPCAVLGVIFGAVALSKVSKGTGDGKGMAIAGLVLSIISIVPAIIMIILGGSLMSEMQSYM